MVERAASTSSCKDASCGSNLNSDFPSSNNRYREEQKFINRQYRSRPSFNFEGNARKLFNNNCRSFVNGVNTKVYTTPTGFSCDRCRENNGFNAQSSAATIVCWNCWKPNHTYQNCRQKRFKFCYRCGQPNVTVSTCEHCSENAWTDIMLGGFLCADMVGP